MRENYAQLYGQVHEPPRIMSDRTGNLTRGVIALKVVRLIPGRDRLSHRASVYALPVLLTKNEKMIQEMMKLKEGDMIEAWGPICTNEIVRRSFCPDCQGENQQSGMQFYVSPIYITQREKGLTPDEGMAALTRNEEISNRVFVMGRLCRDPQAYDPQEERTIYCDRDNDEAVDTIRSCQYQMAIGRNVRIEEDPEDKRADFPWIKSFGDQAKQDFKALRTSSGIYIRGSISTRTFKRHVVCQHCGREYDVQAMASEIVPYSVEYLTNCILPNGQEEEETYVVPSALVQPQT